MSSECILVLIWLLIQTVTAVTPEPVTPVLNSTSVEANSTITTNNNNVLSLSLNSTSLNLNDTATVTITAAVTLPPPVSNTSATATPAPPANNTTATVTPAPPVSLANLTVTVAPPPASNATTTVTLGPALSLANATVTIAPPPVSNETATVTLAPSPVSNETATVTLAPPPVGNETATVTIAPPPSVALNSTTNDSENSTLNLNQSTNKNSTTGIPNTAIEVNLTTSTTTEAAPTTTTEVEISEAEARSDEESQSPQTIEAILFDDESTVLKIFVKEKSIEFKIKLNLTSSTLERRNDTSRAEEEDSKKLNGFVKKLFIGLESGIGHKNSRNRVVDFFSVVLDDVNVQDGSHLEGFVGPPPKIEDLHWNKSSDDGFQLLADKCQDYRLKSYYSRENGTMFEMLVSRVWETCDEEDIQFYTPELTVWWMLGMIPANVEEREPEPEVLITDTLTDPNLTTESPTSNVSETTATINSTMTEIINETTPSSDLSPNSNTQIAVLNLNSTTVSPNAINATEIPLAKTTVAPSDNVTATEPAPSVPTTIEPVTTTTTVGTTRKPRVRMLMPRKRLRFSAALVNDGSHGKPLEITEFGFVGPLSISLISSLKNYALYVVLKDCSRLHAQPKRFACVLNDYLDQVKADSMLAYRHHLAIEKYAEVGDSLKKPDESIIRNCPFNKAPRTSNHNGIGKTKSRKSKHLELPKKNSAPSTSMKFFEFKNLVAFSIMLFLSRFGYVI